ncbi:hypothetical protein PR048_017951 [Dryococelus australis]|uniref:Secreted protein n=1 Tax=Dryococelus australis TaxID=614101 RepID=A0ABQ9HB41_9NEOP|nr:hypothetical protein PR048_017951 [Dryococelus australis]
MLQGLSALMYLRVCYQVRLGLEQSSGVSLVSGQGSVVSCVQERTNWVHTFHVRLTWLGEVNVTVTAVVDPDYGVPCGPDPLPVARSVL